MKKIVALMVLAFTLVVSMSAQEEEINPNIIAKCAGLRQQLKSEFKLTTAQAEFYYDAIIQKYSKDAKALKNLTDPDSKKEYYKNSSNDFVNKLKEMFPADKADEIRKWTSENQSKFNNPNAQAQKPESEGSEGSAAQAPAAAKTK